MIYTNKIKKAINFAILTHEVTQKQKRKGKDIAYITHPLTVGIILSRAGASEDIVVAGILHDTIEDSIKENKVTKLKIQELFGDKVAELVGDVTEENKELTWEERKSEAREHLKIMPLDSLMVKSADLISNTTEILEDFDNVGFAVFDRFNADKRSVLRNYILAIQTILERWQENPLTKDLEEINAQLSNLEDRLLVL
jgi:(p)ppGpp synthase/HD superfamily hydrolase